MDILNHFRNTLTSQATKEQRTLETIYVIMKEFGYTLEEVQELPLPTYFFIIEMLNKEAEQNKKAMRKKR